MKKLKYTYFYITLTVIILITAYMFLTSNLFLNNFLLKTISSDTGVRISAKKIDLSLFKSELIISDYRINKLGIFSLEGKEIKCSFSILDLLKKKLYIEKLSFDNSIITVFSTQQNIFIKKTSPKKISNKFFNKISFHNLSFSNSSLGVFKLLENKEKKRIISVKNINFKLPVFTDGQLCNASFGGNFWVESENDKYESSGKITGDVNILVDKNFNPMYFDLNSNITNIKGFIENISFSKHNIIFEAKAEMNNDNLKIKFLRLKEYLKDQLLSDIHLDGMIKPNPFSFDFKLNIKSISGELLNTLSALVSNYQFIDSTRLSFNGQCLYRGDTFSSKGDLHIDRLSIPEKKLKKSNNSILNVNFKYDFLADIANKTVAVNEFNLKIKAPDNGKIDLYSKGENILDFKNNSLNLHEISGMVFHAYNFDLGYISNLLWNVFRIERVEGRLNAVMGLSAADNNLKLKGPIELSSLLIKKGNFFVDKLNLRNNIACSFTNKFEILFDDVSGVLFKDNNKISQIDVKGKFDVDSNSGALDVRIPYINYDFLNIFYGDHKETAFYKIVAGKLNDMSLDIENKFKFDLDNKIFLIDKLKLKLKDKENIAAVFETSHPLEIESKDDVIILADKLIKFKIKSTDYDLANINKYVPFTFKKGKLNTLINGEIYGDYKEIKLSGAFKLNNIALNIKNEQFTDLTISNKFDLKLIDFKRISLKSNITELFKNKKFILTVLTSGNYNFKDQTGKVKTKITESDLTRFDEIATRYLKPHGIELLKITGDLFFELKDGMDEFVSSGKFKGSELSFTNSGDSKTKRSYNGKLEYKIAKTNDYFKIDPLHFKINENSDEFLDFLLNVFIPEKSDKNIEAKLYSDNLNLKKIIDVANNFHRNSSGSNEIRLKNLNSFVNIYFENMYFGPFIKMDLESKLIIKNGYLKLDSTILNLNETPIFFNGNADFSSQDELPFKLGIDFSNLNIPPFLKSYDEKVYDNTQGVISKFDLNLNGDLINRQRLFDSLKGKLKATCKNISLPFDFSKFDFIRLMFVPFEVMTKMSGVFDGANIPTFFSSLMHFSKNIFTKAQNLDIEKGNILFEVYDQKIYIDKFSLNAANSPMKSLNVSGNLGFDGSLNIIETIVGNNNFILPIVVKGSVDKPIPDSIKYIKLVNSNFVRPLKTIFWNTLNLPKNLVNDFD
jgi:hypothetical protein